jgi:hypothetical protein
MDHLVVPGCLARPPPQVRKPCRGFCGGKCGGSIGHEPTEDPPKKKMKAAQTHSGGLPSPRPAAGVVCCYCKLSCGGTCGLQSRGVAEESAKAAAMNAQGLESKEGGNSEQPIEIAPRVPPLRSAPLAQCEQIEETERRNYVRYDEWCAAKGDHVTTRGAHSSAHMSQIFRDPFGLRRMAAENGDADWNQWAFPGSTLEYRTPHELHEGGVGQVQAVSRPGAGWGVS